MALLDVKSLLDKAVKSADSIIVTADKLQKGKIKAVDCNALTNAYRSAGNLYLSAVQAIEGSTVTLNANTGVSTELSPADKARLEEVVNLLNGLKQKPCKRKPKKEG